MAIDRSAMKSSLAKRQEASEQSKDDRGKYHGIFKDDVQGIRMWKVGEGDHEFDIVPYNAGENDPEKKIKPGDPTYVLILWVHGRIGISEDSYICMAKTYNKRCPVCEYQASLRDSDASDEEIKQWNPVRRTYYNVLVYDNEKEQAKGVQILDIAHYYMEPELLALARPRSRGGVETGEKVYFSSPDKDGKTVAFNREGTRRNTAYKAFKFIDRDYDLEDETLDQAKCLDEIIHIPSYEEVKEALYLGLPEKKEEVQEDIPSEGGRRRGRSATPAPSQAPKEEIKEEKKEEKQEVKEEKKEEPAPKVEVNEKGVDVLVCPVPDGTFGIDIEKLGACAKCDIWDPCMEENNRIMAEKRAARSAEGGGRLKR